MLPPAATAPVETKVLALTDATVTPPADGGAGSFSGYASRFGERDLVGDVVVKGAYTKTLPQFRERGFIAWGHDWDNPVATIREAREDERGLYVEADFHSDPQSQIARTRAAERLARGKFMGLSIGFRTLDAEDTPKGRLLKEIELFETSLVTVPALPSAGVLSAKTARADAETRAVWSTAYINDLPDSAFAVIESGGQKDEDGKTTPRSLRHLPHHDADGAVDPPHLRAALSRLPQSGMSAELKSRAEAHLRQHASALGVGEAGDDGKALDAAGPDAETKVGRRISAANLARIRAAMDTLSQLLADADPAPDAAEDDAAGDDGTNGIIHEAPAVESAASPTEDAETKTPPPPLADAATILLADLDAFVSQVARADAADLAESAAWGHGALRRLAAARAEVDALVKRAAATDAISPRDLARQFAVLDARLGFRPAAAGTSTSTSTRTRTSPSPTPAATAA